MLYGIILARDNVTQSSSRAIQFCGFGPSTRSHAAPWYFARQCDTSSPKISRNFQRAHAILLFNWQKSYVTISFRMFLYQKRITTGGNSVFAARYESIALYVDDTVNKYSRPVHPRVGFTQIWRFRFRKCIDRWRVINWNAPLCLTKCARKLRVKGCRIIRKRRISLKGYQELCLVAGNKFETPYKVVKLNTARYNSHLNRFIKSFCNIILHNIFFRFSLHSFIDDGKFSFQY